MLSKIRTGIAKLSMKSHLFVMVFLIGTLYLHWGSWWLIPAIATVPIPAFIAAYALFWVATRYRRVNGRVYQDAIAETKKQYSEKGAILEQKPRIVPVPKTPIDLKGYIAKATNSNLFITGRSGSGKSTLMCYTIGLFEDSKKTIFSFKANDEYLKLGIPILRINDFSGNPFADKEAFVQAFLVTYPMTSQGIIAASVPNLLRTLLKMCDSWDDLKEAIKGAADSAAKGSITQSALLFIEQKIPDLELVCAEYDLEALGSVVLDFSGLNEAAKSFYAELYLRETWHRVENSKEEAMKNIIIIDEAHRLLKSDATVFGEIARLIRSRGALWCGTQNYSDLPDYVRNQFAIQLLFSTKSEKDLKAIKEINALLPFVATEIRDHHFTDVAARELHDEIPIYTTDIGRREKKREDFVKPDKRPGEPKERKVIKDYSAKILEMLEEEACWPTKLARIIADGEAIEFGEAKIMVARALRKLRKEGLVGRKGMQINGKEGMLYYRKDSCLSGLHQFMEKGETRKLEKQGAAYELAKPGEDKPDIVTRDFNIEIETGLKNDLAEFTERISNVKKRTYVIVPNEAEKKRYQRVINNPLVTVFLPDEF